ncbi:DUF1542 domain-containing protein, partial [Convivina praedatoris]|uniref:DUF1542 domain-containing protein n=5 Tax=Convivina praedatoris TaxID=2880963 RepID=UPI00200F386F
QGVEDAKNTGVQTINAIPQSAAKSLDDQKNDAKQAIETAKQAAIDKINNDKTLTDAAKQAQRQQVTDAATQAAKNIGDATDAQGVEDAKNTGVQTINAIPQSAAKSLDDQKNDAKQAIADEAAKVKQDIANDATLNDKQKAAQQQNVDAEAKKATDAINGAQNAQAIQDATAAGVKAVDEQHGSGKSLEDQKSAAVKRVNEEASIIIAAIDDDITLTNEQKTIQKHGVANNARIAVNGINAATNAQSIQDLTTSAITAIDAQYVAGDALSRQKDAAKREIDQESKDIKAKIDQDLSLTDGDKIQQIKIIESATIDAKASIDNAENAQDVKKVTIAGKVVIDKAYQTGMALSDQKDAAKKEIDEVAKATKKAIADDVTLTDEQKATQVQAINRVVTTVREAINQAKTGQEVKSTTIQGKRDVEEQHQVGLPLDSQKASALQALVSEATKVKTAIDQDVTLTDKQKEAQKSNVDAAVKQATDKVQGATNAQGIQDQVVVGNKEIGDQHVAGKPLEDQKQAALNEITKQGNEAKKAIDQDATLTDKQKEAQKSNVDAAVKQATDKVQGATNAQGIQDQVVVGNKEIGDQHVAGKPLEDQKQAALNEITKQGNEAKKAIDQDATLTDKQKEAQKSNVDAAVKQATDKVQGATNAQGIQDQVVVGNKEIGDQHVAGKPLEDQKQAALNEITKQGNLPKTAQKEHANGEFAAMLSALTLASSTFFGIGKKRKNNGR